MLIIITGETCPTCKMAKQMLQKKGMEYREVSADTDEGKRLLKHYNASSLPLIIEDNCTPIYSESVLKHIMQKPVA